MKESKLNFGKAVLQFFLGLLVFSEVFFRLVSDYDPPSVLITNWLNDENRISIDSIRPNSLRKFKLNSSGTGFFITKSGYILTNQHVINTCEKVVVRLGSKLANGVVLKVSKSYDIAVIKVPTKSTSDRLIFPLSEPKLAEKIYVFGFPLSGLLSKSGNFSEGIVSAEVVNELQPTLFQITAPIQSGNSGSAILNGDGLLVGIATAKFDARALSDVTGEIVQNVNFALRAEYIKNFLKTTRIGALDPDKDKLFLDMLNFIRFNDVKSKLIYNSVQILCYSNEE